MRLAEVAAVCCMDALTLIVHPLELLVLMMSMASIHILAATFILLHKITAMYIFYGYYCLPFQSVGQMVMVDPSVLQNPDDYAKASYTFFADDKRP